MASIWLLYGFYMASIWLLYGFYMAISAATNKAPTYLNKLSEQLMPYGWFGYGIHNCINCTKTITSPVPLRTSGGSRDVSCEMFSTKWTWVSGTCWNHDISKYQNTHWLKQNAEIQNFFEMLMLKSSNQLAVTYQHFHSSRSTRSVRLCKSAGAA